MASRLKRVCGQEIRAEVDGSCAASWFSGDSKTEEDMATAIQMFYITIPGGGFALLV